MQKTPINMNEQTETAGNSVIDNALDMLVSAPTNGERLLDFVKRCTKCVPHHKEREELTRAILDTLVEAGFKALDPADDAQQFLVAMESA